VTFLGGLHWPPNAEGVRWFVEEIWPVIARAVPGAVFTVIGKPGLRHRAHQDRAARIEETGYVEDVRRYVEETAVFVVPLKAGAGMRVKILDAWCWGLPVVSTTVGAEGLAASDGDHLMLADDAPAFASGVIEILGNQVLAERLSAAGRATVEARYDWRTVYRAWDQVYH
jgi:glycosyltransferase involved in cell wall biosynthesis